MTVRPLRDVLDRVDLAEAVDPSKVYPTMGVRSFGRGAFPAQNLKGTDTSYPTLRRVERNLLVYPKLMAWEGAFAVVPEGLRGRYVSPEFVLFRPRADLDPAYLAHLVTWEGFRDGLLGFSTGTNARRRRLQPDQLLQLEMPLPDIDEQRRIAAHLDRIAKAGSTPRRSRTFFRTLKERALAVALQEAGRPVALGSALRPKGGADVSANSTYRIAGVYSFGRGLLDRGSIQGTETKYATLTRLDQGDVVYSKLGAFEGAVAVVDDRYSGAYVSPEFPVFAITGDVDPDFLRHQLTSPSFEHLLASTSAGVGARQKRVHPKDFLSLSITLPERPLQERWAAVLGKVDAAWEMGQQAARLSDALLPAARNEIFSAMR